MCSDLEGQARQIAESAGMTAELFQRFHCTPRIQFAAVCRAFCQSRNVRIAPWSRKAVSPPSIVRLDEPLSRL